MTHDAGQGQSLREIRNRIREHQLTPTPITAILEISIRVDLVQNDRTKEETKIIRDNVRASLIREVTNELNQPVVIAGAEIRILFSPTFAGAKHFTSQAGHMDFVKSAFVKAKTRKLNQQWQDLILGGTFDQVASASVQFLLSRPLDYRVENLNGVRFDEAEEENMLF
eukprot:c56892_g1_i1.p1 GENE.c56892_g1_i1~~c56892_g1_i1.p1  ORF type:complete len:176 (+),score=32.09 c56892_g1_i1:27-530(+)